MKTIGPWLALTALGFLGACSAPSLDLMPRYGRLDVSGDAAVSVGPITADADLESAGLDSDDTWLGRADFKWGLPHLVVLGQDPRFAGSGTLDAEVSAGPVTIPVGADVSSELDVGLYSALLLVDLIPGDTLEIGIGVGVSAIDYRLSVTEDLTSATVTSEEEFIVPVLAADVVFNFGSLELAALASGLQVDYNDEESTIFDADIFARWKFLGGDQHLRASFVAGYRHTLFDLAYEDDGADIDTDFTISGPYAGIEVSL